jgi:hypothetical protein
MLPGAAPPAVRRHRRNLDHQGAPPLAEESPHASLPSARVRDGRRRRHHAGFARRPKLTAAEGRGGELGPGRGGLRLSPRRRPRGTGRDEGVFFHRIVIIGIVKSQLIKNRRIGAINLDSKGVESHHRIAFLVTLVPDSPYLNHKSTLNQISTSTPLSFSPLCSSVTSQNVLISNAK